MDEQTQQFLELFFAVEQVLRKMCGGRDEGFSRLLNRARDENAVVRRFEAELRALNELRNLLVHAPLPIPLARPSPQAVAALQFIHRQLTNPQRVLPRFARQVAVLADSQTFGNAVDAMHRTGYSQFPIYRDRIFVGLLTDGLMARWMVAHIDRGFQELRETPLHQVLDQAPRRASMAFVSRTATVPEVMEMFEQHIRHGQLRLDAILITENGRPDEAPLGIITPTDAVAMATEEAQLLPADLAHPEIQAG